MIQGNTLAAALGIALLIVAQPAFAAGPVTITQTKATNGGVTTGDDPGFPVTISEPGSYRLADNLIVPNGKNGIVVKAPDVTIDLDGFRISGGPAGGTMNGRIGIFGQVDRLTVRNGTIGAFEVAAIRITPHPYLTVENMRLINGAGDGIDGFGSSFIVVRNSVITLNLGDGIVCGDACQVEGNVISGNLFNGVSIETGTVLGNTITDNGNYGISESEPNQVGYGNNTIVGNAVGQVDGGRELQPNNCGGFAC